MVLANSLPWIVAIGLHCHGLVSVHFILFSLFLFSCETHSNNQLDMQHVCRCFSLFCTITNGGYKQNTIATMHNNTDQCIFSEHCLFNTHHYRMTTTRDAFFCLGYCVQTFHRLKICHVTMSTIID